MRIRHLLPALVLGLAAVSALVAVPAPSKEKVDERTIAKLIEKLGDDSKKERESAVKELEKIGAPALKALEQATKSKNADVQKTATALYNTIESSIIAKKLLEPKMVELSYKNTPLKNAVADFNKKSGYLIVLHDPDNKLKDKKITLDTGKVTFWTALEKFCAAAGVVEGDPNRVNLTQPVPLPPRPIPGGGVKGGGANGNVGKPAVQPVKPIKGIKILPIKAVPAKKVAPAQKAQPANNAGNDTPVANPPANVAQPAPAIQAVPVKVQIQGNAAGVVQIQINGGAIQVLPAQGGGAAPAVLPALPPMAVPGNPGGGPPGIGVPPMPGRKWVEVKPGQITLLPAKAENQASDTSSAVRIRALPNNKSFANWGGPNNNEIGLPLEITVEPKLQYQSLKSIEITKAIDDNKQNLKHNKPESPKAVPFPGGPRGGIGGGPGGVVIGGPAIMPIGPMMPWMPAATQGLGQLTIVKFAKGTKTTKTIKELKGTAEISVLGESTNYLVADNILKAGSKKFTGKLGGSFEIASVETNKETTTIKFKFTQPTGVQADWSLRGPAPKTTPGRKPGIRPLPPVRGGAAAGGVAVPAIAPAPGGPVADIALPFMQSVYNGISLRDDKGNILGSQIRVNYKRDGNKFSVEYVCTYTAKKGDPKPSRLVFTGRKSVDMKVPFVLKDIKLP